jgi:transcription antitermination factor NusG
LSTWSVAQMFSDRYAFPGLGRLGLSPLKGDPDPLKPSFYNPRCRRRAGVKEFIQPLFPSYLFIFASENLWARVTETFGIARLLMSSEEQPAVIPPEKIEDIRSCEGPDGIIDLCRTELGRRWFLPGQPVRAIEGAFIGYTGTFEGYLSRGQVSALFSFMGRRASVILREEDLEVQNERPKSRSRRKRHPEKVSATNQQLHAI